MNRRSFLKTVTGFIAGVVAVVLPSKVIGKKRSGTRLATEKEKAEYCVSKPLCKKCNFVRNCLLQDMNYTTLLNAYHKIKPYPWQFNTKYIEQEKERIENEIIQSDRRKEVHK